MKRANGWLVLLLGMCLALQALGETDVEEGGALTDRGETAVEEGAKLPTEEGKAVSQKMCTCFVPSCCHFCSLGEFAPPYLFSKHANITSDKRGGLNPYSGTPSMAGAPRSMETRREQSLATHDHTPVGLERCGKESGTNIMFWGMMTFCIIVVVAMVVLCGLAWHHKKVEGNVRYCFEMVLLLAVLVLISWGTYHLLSRIVEVGGKGYDIPTLASLEDSGGRAQTQELLGHAMERWVALLGVLGAFFGLVLPVGGHLLQLKTLNLEEEKVNRLIQEKQDEVTKEMEKLVDDTTKNVDAKVDKQVGEIWIVFANMQYLESEKCFQALCSHHTEWKEVSPSETWLWAQWIICLLSLVQTLNRVLSDAFVKAKLKSLIGDIETIQQRRDYDAMRDEFKGLLKDKRTKLSGGVEKLRERCPDEMQKMEALLVDFGVVFEENGGLWAE